MLIQRDIKNIADEQIKLMMLQLLGGGHNGLTTACYLAKAGLKCNRC